MGRITQQEALYVLWQALHGFHILYVNGGSANINDEMIGFTPDGRVKVWLNGNYAKNLPEGNGMHAN